MTSPTNPIGPPRVLFCRPRPLIRALALAGVTLAAGEAMGQLGYSYSWAQRYGSNNSTRSDYGRGVAVLTDGVGNQAIGTVVSVGEYTGIYDGGSGTSRRKAYTTFVTPLVGGGVSTWSRQFQEVSNAEVSAYGVAVNSPDLDGSRRHAFVVGWFTGQVGFGAPAGNKTATNQKDAFVARIDADTQSTDWVTCFTGTGDQACLAVGTGPDCAGGGVTSGTETVRYTTCALEGTSPTFLAAGGYFTNQITFPYYNPNDNRTVTAVGNEDAYLALVYSKPGVLEEGKVYHAIGFGSSGHDRITGVAIDPVDQSIYVTGFFSGNNINFDPDYHPNLGQQAVGPNTYSGGTDIFVAKYALAQDPEWPNNSPYPIDIRLVWRCCTGTSGDDSGTGIAIDTAGVAYVSGFKRDAGGTRDIWVARYPLIPVCPTGIGGFGLDIGVPANWSLQYTAAGDQAANGIALDGLDRVLVTGQFAGTVDFNRGAGVDNRTSAGGQDIFITRLSPVDSAYLGTYAFGSTKDDVGAAIGVDPVQSMRMAHAGYFGEVDAGTNYNVDFDPNAPIVNLTSKGKADGYSSSLIPSFPTDIQTQVTLVLDGSGSVFPDPYQAMVNAYHTAITDGTLIPQTGKAALNAVFYGEGAAFGIAVTERMPWTVIDSASTATLFANRLRNLARRDQSENYIDEALQLADQSHRRAADMGLDACYHILSVVSDGRNSVEVPPPGAGAAELQSAVFGPPGGGIIGSPMIDQIDGYGAKPQGTQAFFLAYMAASDVAGAAFALESPENDVQFPHGFEDPLFLPYLKIMLSREAHCPGDYDGSGQVNGTDQSVFDADWSANAKKADLNWDGAWTQADKDIYTILKNIGCCP